MIATGFGQVDRVHKDAEATSAPETRENTQYATCRCVGSLHDWTCRELFSVDVLSKTKAVYEEPDRFEHHYGSDIIFKLKTIIHGPIKLQTRVVSNCSRHF